jgi:hypothetical protein
MDRKGLPGLTVEYTGEDHYCQESLCNSAMSGGVVVHKIASNSAGSGFFTDFQPMGAGASKA